MNVDCSSIVRYRKKRGLTRIQRDAIETADEIERGQSGLGARGVTAAKLT
jgi:hypothetical protein